jgi:hypothetical protein
VKTRHDQLAQFAQRVFDDMSAASAPGKYFVNIIPQLRYLPDWFPGTTFKKDGRRVMQQINKLREETYQATLNAMVGRADEHANVLSHIVYRMMELLKVVSCLIMWRNYGACWT